MKKIINISLILIMSVIISMLGNKVYAKSSATMQLNSNYSAGDEVVVEAKLSDLTTDRGVIALGAVLEYDKTALELKEITGQNNWVASMDAYNPESGKLIVDRDSAPAKTDEVVLKLTFKVKDMSASSANITLKEIEMADGGNDGEANLNSVTKPVAIKVANTQNPNSSTTTETSGGQATANSGITISGNGSQATNPSVGASASGSGSQTTNSGVATDGNEVQAVNPDGTTSEDGNQEIKPDENNASNENTDKANTKTDEELPKAGKNNIFIIVLAIIAIIAICGVYYFKVYKK